MIRFENVSKIYENGTVALDDFSFEVQKGEFVFLVGHSGAGKSTITKLLTREEKPTSGEIYWDNEDITKLPEKEVPYLRRRIGMVFQDFRLLPNKTIYENVAFAMQIMGTSTREIRRTIPNLLSMVNVTRKARTYPRQLSGGEQQRVALARALANKPPLIIADEPTGNLDPKNAMEIMQLLEQINLHGTTVIVATHAKEIVNSMKKRVIAISNGKLIRDEERGEYYEIPSI